MSETEEATAAETTDIEDAPEEAPDEETETVPAVETTETETVTTVETPSSEGL